MTDAPDKRALLDRLRINRDEDDEDEGVNRWLIIGAGAIGVMLIVLAMYAFWPRGEDASVATAAESTAPAPTAAGAPGASAPGAPIALQPPAGGGVLSASGYVTARRLATVSAEITGRVAEVLVEEGMKVDAGQILARLDPTLAQIEVDASAANLTAAHGALGAAEADRAEAQRSLVRIQGLKTGDYASKADTTRAEATAKATAARLVQAQGNLAAAEQNLLRARALLAKHEVRAPFAGVVTTKDAQPGEIVSPAAAGGGFTRTGICTIVDMNSLEVEVEVNESFISRVKPGQKASATLDAYPDWEIKASVAAIIPTANREKATVKVRVALDERDPRVLPEMAAKVIFYASEEAAARAAPQGK